MCTFLPRCMHCHEKAVHLSVKGVDCECDKAKDSSAQIFKPYERTFILVFWQKEWLVTATPST